MRLAVPTTTIHTVEMLRLLLSGYQRSMTASELTALGSRIAFRRDEWKPHLAFDPNHFCFRTLFRSPYFEVNIIGWRSGQCSSVHDHRGCACCVRVLEGVLTNRDYELGSAGKPVESGSIDVDPGETLTRSDFQIHRCANEQSNEADLATLHLYSPPLRPLAERVYS